MGEINPKKKKEKNEKKKKKIAFVHCMTTWLVNLRFEKWIFSKILKIFIYILKECIIRYYWSVVKENKFKGQWHIINVINLQIKLFLFFELSKSLNDYNRLT